MSTQSRRTSSAPASIRDISSRLLTKRVRRPDSSSIEANGNGFAVLASAKRDGFNPDVINVLAMNYGASVDNGGQTGQDAVLASSNTALQVKAAGLTSRIGIVPMIAVNDVSSEVFTPHGRTFARVLRRF